MKIFSFIPTSSIKKTYDGLILKYKKHDSTIELLKVGILATAFIATGLIYLYYINRSSTEGYFLRQENNKLNTISFNFEVLKIKLLDYKQKNRDSIQSSSNKREVINVKVEVVKLPGNSNLVYK